MKTVTFFSYKGGVGRTLAAVNFAVYAARQGQATAMLDFDLDAPGVDAKFSEVGDQEEQGPGLIDYILDYQEEGRIWPSIKPLARAVLMPEGSAPLWIIPAGRYLTTDYYTQLRRLDFAKLFSKERDGVGFFQGMLEALTRELGLELIVVDSRAGITDISGICTQQLADEVVLLTSLAAESVRITRRLLEFIRESPVAQTLEKARTTKVVLTRLPKPGDLPSYQERMAERLGVPASNLFFLFSSKRLETEEFIAMREPTRDEELTHAYLRLFQGLDVRGGQQKIQEELRSVTEDLLSAPPEQSEHRLRELAAIYPHAEVYWVLARFYELTQQHDKLPDACWRVLNIVPGDRGAEKLLLSTYIRSRSPQVLNNPKESRRFWRLYRALADRGALKDLKASQLLGLGYMLRDAGHWTECVEVTQPLLEAEKEATRRGARSLASLAYFHIGQPQRALETALALEVENIPEEVLPLVDEYREKQGSHEIWEAVLSWLRTDLRRLRLAIELLANGGGSRRTQFMKAVNGATWWSGQQKSKDVVALLSKANFSLTDKGHIEDDDIGF